MTRKTVSGYFSGRATKGSREKKAFLNGLAIKSGREKGRAIKDFFFFLWMIKFSMKLYNSNTCFGIVKARASRVFNKKC